MSGRAYFVGVVALCVEIGVPNTHGLVSWGFAIAAAAAMNLALAIARRDGRRAEQKRLARLAGRALSGSRVTCKCRTPREPCDGCPYR